MKEIIKDKYLYCYSCSEPMHELFAVLCTSKEEWIEAADFMVKLERSNMWEDGVKIYRKYGKTENSGQSIRDRTTQRRKN